jgi:hypothetical protein
MLIQNLRPRSPFICTIEDDEGDPPDPAGGAGGGGGGGGAASGVPQAEVDRIVKNRVEETRQSVTKKIMEELGVDMDTAKQMIADSKKRDDDEKSDATKAKEAADAEKAAAATEKEQAAKDRHDAKVERALVRVAPTFEDDKDKTADQKLDAWVSRVGRLLAGDVEVGADADAIADAVKTLKTDMPELFGAPAEKDDGNGTDPPPSDPPGTPPKKKGTEDAYQRGLERAKKAGAGASTYAILENQKA